MKPQKNLIHCILIYISVLKCGHTSRIAVSALDKMLFGKLR